MGGKGTYAIGNNVGYTYQTVGKIDGVKVLKGMGNLSNRPNRLLTAQEYEKYKKYFGGKLRWKADE